MDASRRRLAALGLIALMTIGSLLLWTGIPLGWLWIGSQVADSSRPSMGPYVLVGCGIVVSMVVVARLLGWLNALYARVNGSNLTTHVQLPWLKSMRGEEGGRPTTVLDVVMVVTVASAATAMAIWFFFLAGSSLPG